MKKNAFNHGKIVNIYIVYEIEKSLNISSYPTIENCLFSAVKSTKPNNDVDQYKLSGYGIEFDRKGFFSTGNEIGRKLKFLELIWVHQQKLINEKKTF